MVKYLYQQQAAKVLLLQLHLPGEEFTINTTKPKCYLRNWLLIQVLALTINIYKYTTSFIGFTHLQYEHMIGNRDIEVYITNGSGI